MPAPLPIPTRKAILRRWQAGQEAATVAADLDLIPRSVRRLYQRFRDHGISDIGPNHRTSNTHRQDAPAYSAALALRQEHPTWGAPLIHVMLGHNFPKRSLPCPRTLQRWFAHAGLGYAPKTRMPGVTDYHRADFPHDVWQMDAAEQLKLADGHHQVSWLKIVDEHTGAVLLTKIFDCGLFNQVPPDQTQKALRQAFTTWGLPGALRVDNGPPWGSKGDLPTDVALWVLGLGVDMIWNPPRRPQRNGVVERFQGVGQRWSEPGSCSSAQQLQRKANRFDRLQREEYPVVADKSRLQVHPKLAHSGQVYNQAWEKTHWSLGKVADYLASYSVPRQVDSKGEISLYNSNRYVGRHEKKAVWVTLDPKALAWLVTDAKGNQLRELAAPEIDREKIRSLSVSTRRHN
jgi:transposase InsO family protein